MTKEEEKEEKKILFRMNLFFVFLGLFMVVKCITGN